MTKLHESMGPGRDRNHAVRHASVARHVTDFDKAIAGKTAAPSIKKEGKRGKKKREKEEKEKVKEEKKEKKKKREEKERKKKE